MSTGKSSSRILLLPFADKRTGQNKKVFRRKHGIDGGQSSTSKTTTDFTIPYDNCKIDRVEIVGCQAGDIISFYVLDTPAGTISGTAGATLNQFGFDVRLPENFYADQSNYDADLIKDMKIRFEYTAASTQSDIYYNVTLHEVKA